MNDFYISPMTDGDAYAASLIEKICFSDPWSQNAISDSLKISGSKFFASFKGGIMTGYGGMYIVTDEAQIMNIAVHPDFRRSGYASEILSALLSTAKNCGAERIFLEVRISNEAAKHLYLKHGFSELGIRKRFYRLPTEDALIMGKDL